MNYYLRLFFLLTLFSYTNFFGQNKHTLSGTVYDKNSNETLIGVTIYIPELNAGTDTNEYGFYSITLPEGTHKVQVSYLGFTTQVTEVVLSKNTTKDFKLIEESESLEEVVIETNIEKLNIRTPQMSVNKLSAASIKKIPVVLGEVDVIKSIQLLPGVTNAGEGASGFNVRGGAEDQNLILLDEAIIYNASHLFGFFSVFNNDAIKDVKLYKGGIPAKFGGRASSVLDIRQKDGNNKEFKLTGGIGLISSRLTAEAPLFGDKGSFLIAGRASYANIFLALANNENRVGFYDLNFKTSYKLNDKNRLFFSTYFGNDDVSFENSFFNSYGNFSANLRWNNIISDKLFSNLSAIYSRYNYDLQLEFVGLDWLSRIDNYNLKYDLDYYLNDKLKFDFGVSGIYYKFNPGEIRKLTPESSINEDVLDQKFAVETGIYTSLEHKISKNLTAMYGLRYSYFNRFGSQILNTYANNLPVVYNSSFGIYERAEPTGQVSYGNKESIASFGNFEPRFALSYQLNEKSSIKTSYNRMAQYLHLISNTTSATPLDIWAPSGEFLKPQIADQYAIGYFRNLKNNTYNIEIESYYKTVKNRVDYINGAELIAQNTIEREILNGNSRAYGLEFLLRKNKGDLTGWIAYTLSKSEQRTLGGRAGGPGLNNGDWYNTPFDRTHDVSVTGNYKYNDKWTFNANFVFQTGRPVTYPNGQFQYNGLSIPTYSTRNADRLPSYNRLDISATLTPRNNKNRKWQSEWVFGIYNLYSRRNAASISFGVNNQTGANEAERTSIFGITPSITYNFKF
ncbi:TonB-dependent receptor [Tenacibaculum agarivorans]|uniref:TonB-dependent receptor n=1 Tax=Tenacibaculum agarivorans TaxID=1908389 RepID=UPI00094B8247|nr:TonB-dependent receptor [Tenacibaculum agarivorans]